MYLICYHLYKKGKLYTCVYMYICFLINVLADKIALKKKYKKQIKKTH